VNTRISCIFFFSSKESKSLACQFLGNCSWYLKKFSQ